MRGRILPSRKALHQEVRDLRFREKAYKDSLEHMRRELQGVITKREAQTLVQYAVILALANRQGTDMTPIVDAAFEDPAATSAVLDQLLDVVTKLSIQTLEEAVEGEPVVRRS